MSTIPDLTEEARALYAAIHEAVAEDLSSDILGILQRTAERIGRDATDDLMIEAAQPAVRQAACKSVDRHIARMCVEPGQCHPAACMSLVRDCAIAVAFASLAAIPDEL